MTPSQTIRDVLEASGMDPREIERAYLALAKLDTAVAAAAAVVRCFDETGLLGRDDDPVLALRVSLADALAGSEVACKCAKPMLMGNGTCGTCWQTLASAIRRKGDHPEPPCMSSQCWHGSGHQPMPTHSSDLRARPNPAPTLLDELAKLVDVWRARGSAMANTCAAEMESLIAKHSGGGK